MALSTGSTVIGNNPKAGRSTDLDQLWQKAFAEYNGHLKGKSSGNAVLIEALPRVRTLDGVIAQVDKAQGEWDSHRHDGGGLDRLRSAVAEYLGLAQTVGDLVVQSAVASFPPAAAIWTVATYAIKTAQTQHADYDRLANLVVEAGGFLQVLHIIRTKVPDCKQYQECVTEVFTALLVVFAIYTRFMNETRHFTFFRDAIRGPDPELAATYTKVRKAIDRLSQANGFRAVANTEDLLRLMGDLDLKLDMQHHEIMKVFAEQGKSVEGLFQLGREQMKIMQGVDKVLKEMVKNANTKKQDLKSQGISSPLKQPNLVGANLVNFYFASPTDPAIQYREIDSRFVAGTSQWFFERDLYLSWKDGKFPILWISGARGLGKTFLAYTIAKSLKEDLNTQPRTSVAYYFFKEEHPELRSCFNALCCIVIQIAAMDSKYCEEVAADVSSDQSSTKHSGLQYIWKKYVTSKFGPKSDAELYLVLDGLDETQSAERSTFVDLLNQIQIESLKIRVVLTGRPGTANVEELKREVVEITMEQASHDIARIVEQRCKTRKLARQSKRKMIARLTERADCLLYVDCMVRELKSLGSGRAVWRALDDLPRNLDDLYKSLLQKNKLEYLLSPFTPNKLIDIEEEISGNSASILELARYLRDDDEVTADPFEFHERGAHIDEFATLSNDDGSATVRFRERSLKEFFSNVEAESDLVRCGLICAPLEANLDLLYASVQLLCGPHRDDEDDEDDEQSADRLSYAVNYWYLNLSALTLHIDSATDSLVTRVLNILRKISVHRAEVTDAIDKYGKDDFYADFTAKGLPAIVAWAKRAAASADASFLAGAHEWITKVIADPDEVLHHLAQGHVINWFQRAAIRLAVRSFEGARDALLQRTKYCPITSETTDLEAIRVVAHHFEDVQPTSAGSQRAVAFALFMCDHASEALASCHSSLRNCVDKGDHFLTCVALASIYSFMARCVKDQDSEEANTNWKNANDYVSAAFAVSSEDISSIHPWVMKRKLWTALNIRAECETHAGKYQDAINTNEAARDTWPQRSGRLLRDVVNILHDLKDYSAIMTKMETWGLENRLYCLALTDESTFSSFMTGTNFIFQKAAKLAGTSDSSSDCRQVSARGFALSDSLASMIRIYEEMIEYLERKNQSACLRYRLAGAYREVVGDDLSCKDILDTLLNGDSCYDPWAEAESEYTLTAIRLDLALLIFEEFRASTDPQQKIALLDELEDIPNRRLGRALGRFEIFNSGTAVIQGRMIRKVRSAPEYQAHMERVFQTCMAALSDEGAWNDQASLRILAKLLMCVPGTDRDAQIAISAQLSYVDIQLAQFGAGVDDPDEGERSPNLPPAAGLAKGHAGPPEDNTTADARDVLATKPNESEDVKLGSSDGKDSSNEAPNEPKGSSDNEEEDIMPWALLGCVGCGKISQSWAQMGPMYACLVCPESDLCQECYDKRQALNRGDTSASWRNFCGKDHEYLKAPMPGWKGVKDGVMMFDDDRLEFKVWLDGLRDERWREAWKEFWKGA